MSGRYSSFSHISLFLLSWLVLIGCQDLGTPVKGKPPCPSIRIAAPSPFSEPVWHPSGQFIGFNYLPLIRITYPYGDHCQGEYEWNGDSLGYWIINADGTNLRRISSRMIAGVSWSPDGQWIAFHAGAQIYKMRFTGVGFDTTTTVQLTTEGNNFYPAWSPDGQWIAYDSNNGTTNGLAFIWKMKFDGSQKLRVAYEPTQGEIRMPSWSPNAIWITHIRYLVGTSSSEIFYMDSNGGSSPVRLTFNSATDYYPHYSPDGAKIAFGSKPTDGRFNVWLMNADGSGVRQVTTEGTGDGWSSWSPDGREIVYLSHRHDDWSYANGTLWIVNVETAQKRQLTINQPPADQAHDGRR